MKGINTVTNTSPRLVTTLPARHLFTDAASWPPCFCLIPDVRGLTKHEFLQDVIIHDVNREISVLLSGDLQCLCLFWGFFF